MNAEAIDLNFQAPVKSVSIENMVRMRAAVMDRFEQAIALLREAQDIAASAHIGYPRLEIATDGSGRTGYAITDQDARAIAQREIDRVAWEYLMSESGLRTFMDADARKKWSAQLYEGKDIPELTPENVAATFRAMHDSRGEMFERGVIRCFRRLSWDYKTNRPFAFGKRIIMGHLFSVYSSNRPRPMLYLRHEATDELDDLMRVFHVLDGKPEPDHRNGIYRMLSDAEHRGERTCENEYVSIKWFLKGSGHVTFKRPKLVDKLNQILAKHYPGALAHEQQ